MPAEFAQTPPWREVTPFLPSVHTVRYVETEREAWYFLRGRGRGRSSRSEIPPTPPRTAERSGEGGKVEYFTAKLAKHAKRTPVSRAQDKCLELSLRSLRSLRSNSVRCNSVRGGIHREARKARKEGWGQAAEGRERGNK